MLLVRSFLFFFCSLVKTQFCHLHSTVNITFNVNIIPYKFYVEDNLCAYFDFMNIFSIKMYIKVLSIIFYI